MSTVPARGWYAEVVATNGHVFTPDVLTGANVGPSRNPKANERPTIRIPIEKSDHWSDVLGDGSSDIDLRVWNDGERQPIDTLDSVEQQPGRTVLEGSGGRELRDRVTIEKSEQQVHKAAEDLVTNNTNYTANVDAPTETTDTNVEIDSWSTDSEFESRYDPAPVSTTPIETSGGAVKTLQTAIHIDPRDFLEGGASSTNTSRGGSSDYVDGFAAELDAAGERVGQDASDPNNTPITFDFDYTIPEEHVRMAVRCGADDAPEVDFILNGDVLERLGQSTSTVNFGWTHFGDTGSPTFNAPPDGDTGWTGGDISSGTVEIVCNASASTNGDTETLAVDWIVIYDDRYSYTFDNTTDGNNELAGPEKYPDSHRVSFREVATPRSVTGARAELTVDEGSSPSNDFAIRLSNDQGANFTVGNNTDTLETDSLGAAFGSGVILQIDLSRYGSQTETPTSGINGHSVSAVTLKADLSSIPIVRNFTADDHIDKILRVLSDIGDGLWALSWDGANDRMAVEWTFPGQRTTTETPDIAEYSAPKAVDTVYQKAAVYGRSDVPVVGEGFTSDHGTAVELDNDRIQPATESVTDPNTGERFTRNIDYTFDPQAGEITTLSAGNLSNSTVYEIDYTFQAFGEYDDGTVSPAEAPPANIPGLVSDFLCQQAARLIVEEVSSPLYTATVTLPNDETAWSVVDSFDPPIVPTGGNALHIKDVANTPEATVLTLGSRRTFGEVVSDIRQQVGAVSRKA